jgi:hypothetical protein
VRRATRQAGPVFWAESIVASVAGFLAVLTLVWPDWIEGVFGVDPDQHNGTVEWALVAGCAVVAVVLAVLARREWRRVAPAQG